MTETGDSMAGGCTRDRSELDAMRVAMYAEMAKAATGSRPWFEQKPDRDAAFEAAIHFILTAGLDQERSRQLLAEAGATRQVEDQDGSVVERCERFAAEFRWRIRHR